MSSEYQGLGRPSLYKYGITWRDYLAMLASQNGVCAACGKPEQVITKRGTRALAVDHCHKTGVVRGLLCGHCNRALGMLNEDTERIKALLRYIEERCISPTPLQIDQKYYQEVDELPIGITDNLY